jgi:hypothetical protein
LKNARAPPWEVFTFVITINLPDMAVKTINILTAVLKTFNIRL